MPLKVFDLDALGVLENGKTVAAMAAHLKRVALDCHDRPTDVKPRTVTMTIEVLPVPEPDGSCNRVEMQAHVTSKLPPHRTNTISLGLHPNGLFSYNPDSPGNVNQTTMLNDPGEEE